MKISEMSCVEIVKVLNGLGCSDTWIAGEIGANRSTIKRIRDGQEPRSKAMLKLARVALAMRLEMNARIVSGIEGA